METIKKKYRKKITNVNTIFYINPEGIKITVFSPYELILKEIISLGIDPIGATISELQNQVSQICIQDSIDLTYGDNPIYTITELTKTKFYTKNIVIMHYFKELSYWLFDYDTNKMPANMKFDFELNRKRNAK
ncbi:hypothetical protein [Flavobacterium sp. W22_SRS_FP1]|uniref:hypothetical protein n=1 Tax=Flavobacterium sp. W22_SRS_FP1 TaxID=3240276 RepID=UPI003F8F1674